MPCYTRRNVTVELKVADRDTLIKGLVADQFRVLPGATNAWLTVASKNGIRAQVDLKGGRVVVQEGDEAIVNQIKRAYSGEVVRQAAKRFGWTLTATKQENQFIAGRRF